MDREGTLDIKEEQKYKRLRKLAQELHIPMPEAFIELEVFDKDGNLIQRHRQRSHSWVRNAYNLLFCQLAGKAPDDTGEFGGGYLSFKITTGAIKALNTPPIIGKYNVAIDDTTNGYRAPAGEDAWGILVGSGTDAESFEDFELQIQIVEGTGAGELNHVESQAHAITYATLTLTNTLIRYFNNNTVGETSVAVNEVALVPRGWVANSNWPWLQSRDKLASTVTVPSTGQLKVTYTIELTYPS